MKRPIKWISVLLFAVRACGPTGSAEPLPNRAVTLPPFTVEEKSLLNWYHFEAPGMEILSACGQELTANFIQVLIRRQSELGQFIPQDLLFHTTLPTTFILFPKSLKGPMEQEMLQGLASIPSDSPLAVNDLRLSDPDSVLMFVFLDDIGLEGFDDSNPERQRAWPGESPSGGSPLQFLAYSPTYVSFLLTARAPALPGWFSVGFARYYGSADFSQTPEEFGPDGWLSRESAQALRYNDMAPRPLLPLRELLVATTPDGKSADYRRVWAAQAELFVRWALSGRMEGGKERLWHFVSVAATHRTTEAFFQSCFGMNYADARDALSDYLPTAVRESLKVGSGKDPLLPPIRLRLATTEEVDKIQGEWARRTFRLVRQVYPKALPLYAEHARRLLQGAYDRGDRAPDLLASLALFRIENGDASGGRELLEENGAACSVRPLAGLELARLRLIGSLRQPAGANGLLSESQAAGVLSEVKMALQKGPPIESGYVLAENVFEHLGRDPTPDELALLDEGARLFARNSRLVMKTASRLIHAGDVSAAQELIDLGLWESSDPPASRELALLGNSTGLRKPSSN